LTSQLTFSINRGKMYRKQCLTHAIHLIIRITHPHRRPLRLRTIKILLDEMCYIVLYQRIRSEHATDQGIISRVISAVLQLSSARVI
jgi:hypothetical protein